MGSVGGRREAIQSEVVLEGLHGDGPCGSGRLNIEGKKAVQRPCSRLCWVRENQPAARCDCREIESRGGGPDHAGLSRVDFRLWPEWNVI